MVACCLFLLDWVVCCVLVGITQDLEEEEDDVVCWMNDDDGRVLLG